MEDDGEITEALMIFGSEFILMNLFLFVVNLEFNLGVRIF